jgi:hypothetical protein
MPSPEKPSDVAPELTPAEEPAAEPAAKKPADEIDDLFREEAAPAEPAAEKAPAETPAPAEKAEGAVDDLFSEPPAEAKPEPAPADNVDDLFKDSSARKPAVEAVAANEYREWTDNTGKYRVNAKLVVVLDGKVRLFKENGRYTTVPFERLSQGDLEFVEQHNRIAAASEF